jgi:hypothetical protein
MNPNTFNAWHIVALGAGAFVVHAYHIVVNAGGLKRIWSNFWNGPSLIDNRLSPPTISPAGSPAQPSTTPPIQKSS